MSLAAIGHYLRSAGYSPDTHCVIGWSSFADYITFHRALLGHSMVLDDIKSALLRSLKDSSGEKTLQPLDLCSLVRQCSDLVSGKLAYVHGSAFGLEEALRWNLPELDCLGMAQLLR